MNKPYKLVVINRELPLGTRFIALPQYGIKCLSERESNRIAYYIEDIDGLKRLIEDFEIDFSEQDIKLLMLALHVLLEEEQYPCIHVGVEDRNVKHIIPLEVGEETTIPGMYLYYDDLCIL